MFIKPKISEVKIKNSIHQASYLIAQLTTHFYAIKVSIIALENKVPQKF